MQRLLSVLAIVLMFSAAGKAQMREGSILLSGSVDRFNYTGVQPRQSYSMDVQYFATDHVVLNYRLSGGNGYFHMPGGLPLGILSLAYGGYIDESILYMFLVPEGVGYSVPLADQIGFVPYVNPLGFDITWGEAGAATRWTGSIGARINFNIVNDLYFTPFTEYIYDYQRPDSGWRTGFAFGLGFE